MAITRLHVIRGLHPPSLLVACLVSDPEQATHNKNSGKERRFNFFLHKWMPDPTE